MTDQAVDRPKACGTAGIILAAGSGTRMAGNGPKQLLPIGGKPILAHVLSHCRETSLSPLILVLGHEAEKIQKELADLCPDKIVVNPSFKSGMASSIRAGLTALETLPARSRGALFILGDQPLVTPDTIEAIIRAAKTEPGRIIIPRFRGRRGNPVYFSRSFFEALAALSGDQGGRQLFSRHPEAVVHVEADSDAVCLDLDTPKDLERLRRRYKEEPC